MKDELKGKAKIEEVTESKENDTSAAKPGICFRLFQYFDVIH